MPTILALETSSDACSVALLNDKGVFEETIISPREHTQRLLPMVEGILKAQNTALADVDGIAYGAGPGSFTGLRICLSVAQGLAYGVACPLIAVSSLLAMAATACRNQTFDTGSIIIPVIDARMDEVYWSAYRLEQSGQLTPLVDQSVSAPELCAEFVNSVSSHNVVAMGNGWQYEALSTLANANLDAYPSAHDIALIGSAQFAAGELVNPLDASPTYLRNEVSWKKRERIRSSKQ